MSNKTVLSEERVLDNRSIEELSNALALAQHTVYKRYLAELESYSLVNPTVKFLDESPENCLKFLRLEKLTCTKGEDIFQKLSTVYHASMSLGCNIAVMIDVQSNDAPADFYIGVRNSGENQDAQKRLKDSSKILQSELKSNFPGTDFISESSSTKLKPLLDDIFKNVKCISSVSCVASARDKSKTENKSFIQGMERFVEAMRGNAYTALFLAEPISTVEQATIRNGYENLYTTLSSFNKSTWSYGENDSHSVMESLSTGTSKSITTGTSHTQGHTISVGANIGIGGGSNSSNTFTESTSKSNSTLGSKILSFISSGVLQGASETISGATAITTGIAKTLGVGLNIGYAKETSDTTHKDMTTGKSRTETNGTTDTTGTSRTIQIENVNKSVEEMLERIDDQLKRVREGEDYGAYSCAAYFLSANTDTGRLAANTYRALMIGEGSSIESGAINTWDSSNNKAIVDGMKDYLRRFVHPIFVMPTHGVDIGRITYTPGTVVSGLELPLHLGLPTKSVYGLPVVEHAEFGRNVATVEKNGNDESISLGNVFHMGKEDNIAVNLDKNSLTMHTFVTGSTGSGKSNTIYQMLYNLMRNKVKFLVVEPAKGEYKHIFGNENGVKVYGTNPKLMPLLRLNPFSFPSDIHVLEHLDRLVEIFNVCWPMYAAMPAVLKSAVEKSYEDCGWDLVKSTNSYGENMYPTFADVARNVKSIIDSSEYDSENKGAYKGSLLTRLHSLTNGINGMVFTSDELSNAELFDSNVIVDLSRVGSNETKSLIMGMIVLKLQEYRMTSYDINSSLKHVTVLEEAHNLLKRTSTEQPVEGGNLLGKSVEMISNAIAEMRTYGEGFIIADQAPALLDMAAIRNTNTKIIMRLPDQSDRELVGRAANLNDDQIAELAKLPCGVAAIYQNEWIQPVLCKIDKRVSTETTKRYAYDPNKVKTLSKARLNEKLAIEIAELICNGTKIAPNEVYKYMSELNASGINAYIQASIAKLLLNPIRNIKFTKIAPIMGALFPKVRDAVRDSYNESSDEKEWTTRAESALNACINTKRISDNVRRDIVQAIITDYIYNDLGNKNDMQRWAEKGGLK